MAGLAFAVVITLVICLILCSRIEKQDERFAVLESRVEDLEEEDL